MIQQEGKNTEENKLVGPKRRRGETDGRRLPACRALVAAHNVVPHSRFPADTNKNVAVQHRKELHNQQQRRNPSPKTDPDYHTPVRSGFS
jgi:hypothetical protein